MAYKPSSSQLDHGLPIDLETTFTGADTVLRSLARSSVGLEKARTGARTREAARIAAKYGADHPRAQAAAAAAALQRAHLVEATRLAGRADVAPIDVGDTGVAITGRVLDASGAGIPALTVEADDANGRTVASSRTDAQGQFRLVGKGDVAVPGKAAPDAGTVTLNVRKDAAGPPTAVTAPPASQPAAAPPAPASQPAASDTGPKDTASTGAIGGNQGIVLVVLDGKAELYRDAQPFTVNPGLVLYREITVKR
jgi:hypothetical protein